MEHRQWILHSLLGKRVHVEVDRPVGYCHHGTVYPVNYGYIPGIFAGDGEDQDAYILGITEPLTAFDGRVVGAIRRRNDCEDKLVVAPEGMEFHQGQIAEAVYFQEQYFDFTIDSLFRKSCGILPCRNINGCEEYLIVFQSASQCWSLPKGHMERGETESETALRELYEETGLTALVDTGKSACIEYPLSPISRKQVVFFRGEVSGEVIPQASEVERYKWVRLEELKDYLFPDTVESCMKLICQKE